ncbi:MAG: AraC family ligand binding domain-containing protein [Alkalispirochaeta sp.]
MIELVAGGGYRFRHDGRKPPLTPLYLGREECSPGHRYGRVREEYLIHYVESGTGSVHTDDTDVTLRRGTAFAIAPGKEHWYQADRSDPWTYWWVGFAGPPERTLAAWYGSDSLPTVVPVPQDRQEELAGAYHALWDILRDDRPSVPPILPMQHLMTVLHLLFTTPWPGESVG